MKLSEKAKAIWNIIIGKEISSKEKHISTPQIIKETVKVKNEKINKVSKPRMTFSEHLKSLRPYQREAFQRTLTDEKEKGQFFLPTGTGKTWIQNTIIIDDAFKEEENNKVGTYVIVSPKILLCNQHSKVVKTFFDKVNLKVETILFNSTSGENIENVKQKIKSNEKNNKHTVIISTYDSLSKLSKLEKINVCAYDEAHNIIINDPEKGVEKFKKGVKDINKNKIISKQYFFTATPKKYSDKILQDDINDLLGPVSYNMSPKKAVEDRWIVPPAIHIIEVKDIKNKQLLDLDNLDQTTIAKTIINSFEYEKKNLSHNLGVKMLVSFKTIGNDADPIYKNQEFKDWCNEKNITRFLAASDGTYKDGENYGGFYIDDDPHTRENFLKAINKINEDGRYKNCVFLYHDILSEGIDIPGLTSIIMFRNLEQNKLKFIQTIGRCCRHDKDKIKEKSWICVPDYFLKTEKYKDLIESIFESYEIKYCDVDILITSADGKSIRYNRKDKKEIEEFINEKGLVFAHKIIDFVHLFEFDKVEKELNDDFNNSKDKEQFLLELINEVYDKDFLLEGAKTLQKEREYFRRNPNLRNEVLKKYGYTCDVCKVDFELKYGEIGRSMVEVHHEKEFSDYKDEHEIKIDDCKVVCANDHNGIHSKKPCYTIEEIEKIINLKE